MKGPSKLKRRAGPPRTKSDPDYMLSLARGLSVIRAFGHGAEVVSIAEAARLGGMSRAAARRCLHTLSVLGYVSGSAGSYRLAPKVLALGYAYLGSAPVARAAQPVLERVADRLHESCSLTVLDGDEIVYVARAATRRILSVGLSVGSRLPVYCTSMGRVLIAFASDAERSVYLSRVRPVRRPDQSVAAAMNVGVQATRVDRDTMVREYLPVLQAAAEEIGFALGHAPR